jgi:hypothetical protein
MLMHKNNAARYAASPQQTNFSPKQPLSGVGISLAHRLHIW